MFDTAHAQSAFSQPDVSGAERLVTDKPAAVEIASLSATLTFDVAASAVSKGQVNDASLFAQVVTDPTGTPVHDVWNRNYQEYGHLFGNKPSETAEMLISRLAPLRAIDGRRYTVFDAGCGTGRDVVACAGAGYDVTGIDIARDGLNLAVQYYNDVQSHVALRGSAKFMCCDIATVLLLHVGNVDAILSHRTIHLMDDMQKQMFVQCAANLLEPKGFLAIGARCERDFKPDQMVWIKEGVSARYNDEVCAKDSKRRGHILNFVTEGQLESYFADKFDILEMKYGSELERMVESKTDPEKSQTQTQLIFMLAQRRMTPQPQPT